MQVAVCYLRKNILAHFYRLLDITIALYSTQCRHRTTISQCDTRKGHPIVHSAILTLVYIHAYPCLLIACHDVSQCLRERLRHRVCLYTQCAHCDLRLWCKLGEMLTHLLTYTYCCLCELCARNHATKTTSTPTYYCANARTEILRANLICS